MLVPDSPTDPPARMAGAEAALATMVRNAVQATLVVDPDGRIRLANAFAAAALGHDDAERLLGEPAPHEEVLEAAARGPLARDLAHFATRDGDEVRVAFAAVPVDLPEGRGVAVAFTDVVEADDDALREQAPARQASLRRVAGEIAAAAASFRVFAMIAAEVGRAARLPMMHVLRVDPGETAVILGAWSDPPCGVGPGARLALDDVPGARAALDAHATVRVPDISALPGPVAEALRAEGIGAVVATPAVHEDRVWGILLSGEVRRRPLPDDVEERMAPFATLVATRAADMLGRQELARLADEQAALRRVATLVAQDVPAPALFAALTRELGLLLGVDLAHMSRYEPDGVAVGVASWAMRGEPILLAARAPDDGVNIASLVWRTGRAAARAAHEPYPEHIAPELRCRRVATRVGAPIVVDGRLWGVMVILVVDDARLPHDVNARVSAFSDLITTAIANSEARAARARLTAEHEAIRHIATLVANDVEPHELFAAVAATVGELLGSDFAALTRFEGEDLMVPLATWSHDGVHPEIQRSFPVRPGSLAYEIRESRRAARVDVYDGLHGELVEFVRDVLGARSAAGTPIFVGGAVWGALIVHTGGDRVLPADTAERLSDFTELVAAALANSQAREEVTALADEQAALRRVATLVAHAAPAEDVLATVSEEIGRLIGDAPSQIVRFDDDGWGTVLAGWGDAITPAGRRVTMEGDSVCSLVLRSGRPSRISASQWSGPLGEYALSFGLHWGAGAPITVDGRLWGAMTVVSRDPEPLPADTEQRIERFAELVGAAISNVETHERLAASRARVVAAADEERQRVVRDLHDGAQQRLVHTIITLKLGLGERDAERSRSSFEDALRQAETAMGELRDLARGIMPEVLTGGGLDVALRGLAQRMSIPVAVDASVGRLPAPVEAAAYFIAAEALTNVAKHARAGSASVSARVETATGRLVVAIADDGVGGAREDRPGLLGLADRVAVLAGELEISSPAGAGTTVTATIPLG